MEMQVILHVTVMYKGSDTNHYAFVHFMKPKAQIACGKAFINLLDFAAICIQYTDLALYYKRFE